jgi:hypothetical protein
MKRKAYQVILPAAFVAAVIVAFVFIIILANANLSFSDSSKNKPLVINKITAAERTFAEEEYRDYVVMVMWQNAKDKNELMRERAENASATIKGEHVKLRSNITEARLDQQKRFIRSFEEFYAIISEEEKNDIDKILQIRVYEE